MRFALDLNADEQSVTTKPTAAPRRSDNPTSLIGSSSISHTESSVPFAITLANDVIIEKRIIHIASSIATTGRSILVTGPFALY